MVAAYADHIVCADELHAAFEITRTVAQVAGTQQRVSACTLQGFDGREQAFVFGMNVADDTDPFRGGGADGRCRS